MMKPLAELLDEIKNLMELNGENPFKTRAFDKGAEVVRSLGEEHDWKTLAQKKKLTDLDGIGKGLSDVISEFVLTGESKVRDELKSSLPEGLYALSQVSGLGPKKARQLVEELSIKSWGELEYACRENRLLNLKGFGEKQQQKILESVQFLNQNQGRLRLPEAEVFAQGALALFRKYYEELAAAKKVDKSKKAPLVPAIIEICGEVRRKCEVVEKVDFIISLGDLTSRENSCEAVRTEMMARLLKTQKSGQPMLPVQFHFCTPDNFGGEWLRLSASKAHFDRLQTFGPHRGGSETTVYASAKMDWIPPECREDLGEFELARAHQLGDLVDSSKMRGAFHFHSTYSDGILTLPEVIAEAVKMKWEYIGISEHSQSAFYAQGLKKEILLKQKAEIEALRLKHPEIEIFWGIESDILQDGSLDYDDETLAEFDFVIASIHSRFQMAPAEMTARLMKAIDHPKTTMIGHLTGRILLGRKGYDFDMEKVLRYAAKKKVVVELNAHPSRLDLDWRFGKLAREVGLITSINPDAHDREGFRDIDIGVSMARKGLFTSDRVLNTRSKAQVKNWLEKRQF